MPDALHSSTVAPPFPHARISEPVEQAADLFSDYCTSKERARDAAEYLALEDLTRTFERLFQALNYLDPRHRGPPGQDPGRAAPNLRAAGRAGRPTPGRTLMARPPDVPDPLDPAAPIRTDDPVMDRARAQTTLAELLRSRSTRWWARIPVPYEPLELPEIPPERLAYLRARRDEIVAALRERRGALYDAAAIRERSTASENGSRQRGSLAGLARRLLAGLARRLKPTSQVGSSAEAAEMKEIAALMRDSGLTVLASSGWESRGLSSSVNYWAVIAHHTAATTDIDNVLINGRAGLQGPLCNWALHDNGDWVLIASGRANHAGEGTIPSSEAYGVEATGPHGYPDTYGPAAFHNYDEYEVGSACILAVMGASIGDLFGHKETARPVGRKIDPYFDMNTFRGEVAAGAPEEDDLKDDERAWLKWVHDQLRTGHALAGTPLDNLFGNADRTHDALVVPGTTTASEAFEILFNRVRTIEQQVAELHAGTAPVPPEPPTEPPPGAATG